MMAQPQGIIPIRIPGYRMINDAQVIIRLEGTGNYTILYMSNSPKPILVSLTLKWFEARLPDFIRVHKSTLVNPFFVTGVIRPHLKEMYLQLITGEHILVSRRRIMDTLAHLNRIKLAD